MHQSLDILWLVNGAVFGVLAYFTTVFVVFIFLHAVQAVDPRT